MTAGIVTVSASHDRTKINIFHFLQFPAWGDIFAVYKDFDVATKNRYLEKYTSYQTNQSLCSPLVSLFDNSRKHVCKLSQKSESTPRQTLVLQPNNHRRSFHKTLETIFFAYHVTCFRSSPSLLGIVARHYSSHF